MNRSRYLTKKEREVMKSDQNINNILSIFIPDSNEYN